ncbi:hypothetical protein AAG570_000355 [Ranatra chinensis]|uniref:C2H2-type domain-containing protein n=1 Tax=Ranatra chinensis TaxID=642074 RepID=A0ABD0ZI08_9HEMI
MTLPMVTCPLCCRPGFSTSDSLCAALVGVTSRKLCCPICNEIVIGLDKFTIHLFGHSLKKLGLQTFIEPVELCHNLQPVQLNDNNNNTASSVSKVNNKSLVLEEVKETLGPNLKNVTINTQNYITNTNITTSTLQTRMFEKVQKRKYNQVFDKDIADIYDKDLEVDSNVSEISCGPVTTSNTSLSEESIVKNDKKLVTREFESCRDLLTKGDFSTSTDDLIETCVSKDISNYMGQKDELKPKDSFSCDSCPFIFPNKTILAMHKQLIHKKVEVETENKRKMFVCNVCPKSFKMRGSLMLHRRVAHSGGFDSESSKQPPPKPACQVCGKFFKKEIHLSQHMKAHDEKQWQCTICAKTFTTKYFLKKHRRLHTGEMPYRCTTCSKAFTFQQSYHKHLLYHSDDKPYCCAQCGRLFKELSTLHNHERIHSGEKPFTCETCGKAFRQRVSYLVHRRIHTGAMPYKCTACNKSFRYKVSERTHKCTAQPPGVVVRTQANLVERLQAAMIKVRNCFFLNTILLFSRVKSN